MFEFPPEKEFRNKNHLSFRSSKPCFFASLKNKKVKFPSAQDIEPQEVLLDNLAQKREAEFGISGKKLEIPLSKRILKVVFALAIVLIFALFSKTFQFQVLENKKFLARAQENKFILNALQASRGIIYDSKLNQLVFNRLSFDLTLDKKKLPQLDSDKKNILKEASEIIKQDVKELEKKIDTTNDQIILVAENLNQETLILLEVKIEELPGFEIQRNSIREYKDGKILSHLIGYTGQISAEELRKNPGFYSISDYVGRDGIEKSYEEILRKNPGKLQLEKDAFGNLISKKVISLPESGKSAVLWLDSDLQKKITLEIEKNLEIFGAKKAAAVALDPKNGGVLALVSIPGFDNNLFNKGADLEALRNLLQDPQQPLYNRAIKGQYPIGSTIKPMIALAALEENLISPSKKINCQGKITIPHKYNPEIIYEFEDWTTHGLTDMRKAIAESCNVYFYTIGGGYDNQEGLGPQRIKKYLELFGWGEKTKIDLPEENNGFLPSPEWKKATKKENWWDGDTYNLSIGQGDLSLTPLQVATAFAAVANGGTIYQPRVVKEIIDNNKNIIREIPPQVLRENFVNSKNLQIIREGMRQGVSGEGSPQAPAILLNSLPVKAAAKTGTAQTPRPNHFNKWITVFAPYDDPQIVLTILIENVKGDQVVTVPIAKEILNWYFTNKK